MTRNAFANSSIVVILKTKYVLMLALHDDDGD